MNNKLRDGFTLLEVLLALALVAVIALIVLVNLQPTKSNKDLTNITSRIVATLREAQTKSIAQDSGVIWGVHFGNGTSTSPYYVLFHGSYSSANIMGSQVVLPPDVCYTTIPSGSFLETTFALNSGIPSTSTSIGLNLKSNGCAAAAIGTWNNTTPLPGAVQFHSAVVNNGYIYTTGGLSAASTSSVFYAPINSDGSISNWTSTAALPSAIYGHSAVVSNGYIYTIGGGGGSGVGIGSNVYFAPINATGSLGNWTSTTAIPDSGLSGRSAVTYNGYIYTTGGTDGSGNRTSTVLYAPINSTGSIGNWTSTKALPSQLSGHSAVVYNGYIYTTAGSSNGIETSAVYFAPINATGSLGNWTSTTALPTIFQFHSAVVNNGYIYTTGGDTYTSVFYAPINSTGSLGNWTSATALPNGLNAHSAVVNNGYIYTTGGLSGGSIISTVFYVHIGGGTLIKISSVGLISS
jgi:prepilin-type N-terminal cleavage/methylation domain-containing protein